MDHVGLRPRKLTQGSGVQFQRAALTGCSCSKKACPANRRELRRSERARLLCFDGEPVVFPPSPTAVQLHYRESAGSEFYGGSCSEMTDD